ncbi:MAG: glutathione S-transferase family protein [Hyphomicrobiales bacterium]
MLKVWGRRGAFNVQKVMWLIGELEHEHIEVGGSFGGLDAPEFLRLNPHGRIPVIDDGGKIVWESHAILRYLAARHGAGRLWSKDPAIRSDADRWMDWALATLLPAFFDLFWGFYRTPVASRDWAFIDKAIERCNRHYGLLDRHLAEQPYLAGDHFTLGDIPAGTTLFRYFALEVRRPAIPHVESWYHRLARRAAYREHVMIPFEELCGKLSY